MHLEAIKLQQKEILLKLNNFPEFYLAGGTALALQIGHRISVDFDFFSKKDIGKNLLSKIKKVFKGLKIKTILNHSEQLTIQINDVKIDFVKYEFPLILNPFKFKDIKILSIPEIAAMKSYALNQRGTLKDYVDLYFILKEKHSTLKEIKQISEKKYQNNFSFRLFLEQLIYLEDVKDEDIQFIKKPVIKKDIAKFLQQEVKNIKL